jgi:hypothetical protein
MQDNKQREKIDLSGGRALGVMALVPYLLGASAFATPVWYLAVLPNVGFNAVNATASDAAYVYDVPAVTTITAPPDREEASAAVVPAVPAAPNAPTTLIIEGGLGAR